MSGSSEDKPLGKPNQRGAALAAGVPSATVSRYLADPESVRQASADKARAAIERLGYQLDHSAQSLKTGEFYKVGILTPGIGPFNREMTRAIQTLLNERGYYTRYQLTIDSFKAGWQAAASESVAQRRRTADELR